MVENTPDAGWAYHPDGQAADQSGDSTRQEGPKKSRKAEVSWTASEFIANHKDTKWYFGFFLALFLLIAAVFLLTRDIISTVTIAVVGVLFAAIANRKPRQLPYLVNEKGVTVGSRFYPYGTFKSFALVQEGAMGSINFMPLQRLQAELTIYFPPEEGDEIVDILAEHLPNDQSVADRTIDRFIKKIHF